MQITLSATKNQDGTATVSWSSSVDTKPHTLQIEVWFGKKKSRSTKYYTLYTWSHWNTNNGAIQLMGDFTIDLNLLDPSWQQANYEGYICQFNNMDSPADQYNCINATGVKITKK